MDPNEALLLGIIVFLVLMAAVAMIVVVATEPMRRAHKRTCDAHNAFVSGCKCAPRGLDRRAVGRPQMKMGA